MPLLWLIFILFWHLGRNAQAAPLIKKVFEIDPLSPINNGFNAWYYLIEGEFDKAFEHVKRWYEMEPDSVLAAYYYGMFMAWNHNYQEAFKFADHYIEKNPDHFLPKMLLLFMRCLQKNKKEALSLLTDEIKQICWNDFMSPWWIAEFYAMINENDEAMKWLERAVEWGLINYPFLSEIDPYLENIREDPRFKELMKKIKVEWENFEV